MLASESSTQRAHRTDHLLRVRPGALLGNDVGCPHSRSTVCAGSPASRTRGNCAILKDVDTCHDDSIRDAFPPTLTYPRRLTRPTIVPDATVKRTPCVNPHSAHS